MSEVHLTAENFSQEVLHSDVPVLVDFWASWCGPCMMLSPIVAELAREQAGKVKVCKLNVDEQPELAAKFSISSIPTLLVFKNGKLADQTLDYMPKSELEAFLLRAIQ